MHEKQFEAMFAELYPVVLGYAARRTQWHVAEDIEKGTFYYEGYDADNYDLNGDGYINAEDEDRARRGARTLGVLSFVGLGLGAGGSVFLARRMAARRKFNPELEGLRARRIQLLHQLQYGGALGSNALRFTLTGHF